VAKVMPNAGDIAREELAHLGLLDFQEVRQRQRGLLDAMPHQQRAAFAAAVAERLVRAHEALPPGERKPYTLGWRELLDAVWRGLAGDGQAFTDISAALARFYLSPQHHHHGQNGPNDADDDPVAATYYAAECFLHGCTDFAVWAAGRGIDTVVRQADDDVAWQTRRPEDISEFAWVLAHPACQGELAKQLEDLELLAERGAVLADDLGSDDEAVVAEFDRRVQQHASVGELLKLVAMMQPRRAELLERLRRGAAPARTQ